MGILYLVATPIGNLEDLSQRALRILSEAQLIAAEDTRQTGKLLSHFGIKTHMVSYHEHNKLSKLDAIITALDSGDVALVSDAGTPGLNDPGYELVRAALKRGYSVSPIPGPSAPVAALVASGLPTDAFLFLGYLPRKSGERRKKLLEVAGLPYTLIFLEVPHRILDSLDDLIAILGDRQAAAARELTKLHEEFVRGSLSGLQGHFTEKEPRGEFTLVIAGAAPGLAHWDEEQLRKELSAYINSELPAGEIAETVAGASGWRKNDVYRMLIRMKQGKI
jgi:16S rRNA (cytidine1402-2'-O)-methyltransferase